MELEDVILHPQKNQRSSELVQKKSALFRDFQVMYSAESEVKQRWSTPIISESEIISAKIF